ncbi:fructose-specific PTS transporter subunit EIIC [Corynebacterium sp. TAE3-ERU12]|uniref:PTS fructose transporter subunit IIABC n=1 Tax=Corynebacterium sp. TAE3-ERU12 TaxID=2849491 RepID=UPI001C468893|nr:fructose-specific PTS transporter subunit EIIC [Corynebacterium sp. TAE3-ERU12]MBV7295289.1 fructose-specific PTS transporter subunit EIIC [Corynebacterium sp. TAE3-ERU12]
MTDIVTPELVELDVSAGTSADDVIRHLAHIAYRAGRATDTDQLADDALAREHKSATGVPGGVAIPHCRSSAITTPTLVFARLANPVDFSGPDGPADLVFLIGAPADGDKAHMKILSKLARALVKKDFRARLRGAESPAEVVDAVGQYIDNKPNHNASSIDNVGTPTGTAASGNTVTRIVAITACPTGIAHTYMAADSLTQAAQARDDVHLEVETQGSSSTQALSHDTIAHADAVIFATDVGVRDRERFAGKPLVECGVKRAINEPDALIDAAVAASTNPQATTVSGTNADSSITDEHAGSGLSWGKRIQQAVMTGVSYMVPFVAASGLLIALGFLFGDFDVTKVADQVATGYSLWDLPSNTVAVDGDPVTVNRSGLLLYLGSIFFVTGGYGMSVIVAILAAYIAYGLAGRPGIAPGFIGGAISAAIGAGFLGGLVIGIIAGFIALGLGSLKVPRWLASLMPVVIIPLLASAAVGLLMYLFLGVPLTAVMTGMQNWLSGLDGTSAAVLGLILGLMMCTDMGGPVNKAAYLFATAGLSTGDEFAMQIMAAVMAAGMVPPLAMALASALRPGLFTPAERENGKAGWLLGASFISEGAIPFAAADPLRVIPSIMAGGAVTGAMSMALGAASRAPHGGIFVLFAIDKPLLWIASIIVGTVVAAVLVAVLKQFWRPSGSRTTAEESAQAGASVGAAN